MRFAAHRGRVGLLLIAISAACAGQQPAGPGCAVPDSITKPKPAGTPRKLAEGIWLLDHQEPACAKPVFEALVRADPRSPAALHGLAQSLLGTGEATAALHLLQQAPARNEDLTLDLAAAQEKSGDANAAGATLVHAVKANPASARPVSALVLLMARAGQLDEAYALADRFAKRYPANLDAQKLFLRVLVATNDVSAAQPIARNLLAKQPNDGELLYLNGVLERKTGDLVAARTHLERSVAANGNFADSRHNLGLVLEASGDTGGAERELRAALALGAADPEAHLHLSKDLRATGDTAGADAELALYQQSMRLKGNREMASSKASEAEQARSKGEVQQAAALYKEAVLADGDDPALLYKYAMALDAAGNTAEENAVLVKVVAKAPENAVAQHQLGYLLFQAGKNAEAEEHFRAAVKANPAFTQAWISLAATLATTTDFAGARDAVGHALHLDPHNAEALQMKRMLPPA